LKEISLPARLSRIGEGAFEKCASLSGIRLPDTVDSLGAEAFSTARRSRKSRCRTALRASERTASPAARG
jgi:hypothetical protein